MVAALGLPAALVAAMVESLPRALLPGASAIAFHCRAHTTFLFWYASIKPYMTYPWIQVFMKQCRSFKTKIFRHYFVIMSIHTTSPNTIM